MTHSPSWMDEIGRVVDHPDWKRPEPTVMTGQYCRLEPLDMDKHGPDLWAQMAVADPEYRQWMYLAGMGPFEGPQDFYDDWTSYANNVDNLTYVVIPTDPLSDLPSVPTGQFSFLRIRPEAGSIEVGFVRFPPQMARSRASTEAQYLLMRHVFDDLKYRRYEWKCNDANVPSMTTAARLGFTFEGTFRLDQINHGRNRNTAWWSVVDDEWPLNKAAFEAWLDVGNFDEKGQQKRSLTQIRATLLAED